MTRLELAHQRLYKPGTPWHLKNTTTGTVCVALSADSESPSLKQVVHSARDKDLVLANKNTLVDHSSSLNMAKVNDLYLMILKRYIRWK